jgi:hypothetical protein
MADDRALSLRRSATTPDGLNNAEWPGTLQEAVRPSRGSSRGGPTNREGPTAQAALSFDHFVSAGKEKR